MLTPLLPGPADTADALDRADLAATALGDRAAFERLFHRHYAGLARFLRRFSGRADLIEDALNAALWVVWRKASQFRGEARVSTWITGIAYRCMLKAMRDAGPADELGESNLSPDELAQLHGAPSGDAADAADADAELRDWVEKGLRLLPEVLRTTMELAYFAGLSCEEIGSVMGCASGTVKARMFNARLRLRNLMPALGGQTQSERAGEQGR